MKFILHLLIGAVAVTIASYIVPGVTLTGVLAAILVALVLGLINTFIKPVLLIFTLPINVLTLGLFSLVINALLVLLAAAIVPGFQVSGFLTALLFAVVLSIINIIFGLIGPRT